MGTVISCPWKMIIIVGNQTIGPCELGGLPQSDEFGFHQRHNGIQQEYWHCGCVQPRNTAPTSVEDMVVKNDEQA